MSSRSRQHDDRMRTGVMSAAAPSINLGDMILRSVVAKWTQKVSASTHVLAAKMPPGFVEGLDLDETTNVHVDSRAFSSTFVLSAARGRALFVVSPGPITRRRRLSLAVRAAANLARALWIRSFGGRVVVLGRAVRGEPSVALRLESALARLSSSYVVRDRISASLVGQHATVEPDLAFAADAPFPSLPLEGERRVLAVSIREGTVMSEEFLRSLEQQAASSELRIVLISQVTSDDRVHDRLAEERGWDVELWGARSHSEQLRLAIEVYERSAVVISNRLHALVFGAKCGASTIGIVEDGKDKLTSSLGDILPIDFVHADRSLDDGSVAAARDRRLATEQRTIELAEHVRSCLDRAHSSLIKGGVRE